MIRAEVLEIMMYSCVTWSPRACHNDTLRRAHHSFLTCCIGWRKNNRTDRSISYLDTLMKMGSESVEAVIRRKRILFTGFVVRIRTGIFPHKKKKKKKCPTSGTINSLVHKIRLHGRQGKGTTESFSREKLRQAPQKEGGEMLCDLSPV